jgi:glycosyltransferase involved in cell wall biosynthesis
MRIAVFLESSIDSGGGFQQALSLVRVLARKDTTHHKFITITTSARGHRTLTEKGIECLVLPHSRFHLALDELSGSPLGNAILRRLRRLGLRRWGRHLDAFLDDHDVDIAFFCEPSALAQCLSDHPFIVTVWDLCHRDHVEFPEVYARREFERRERRYQASLSRAVAVVANCPTLARKIVSLYHVTPERIVELPLLPSDSVRYYAAGNKRQSAEAVRHKYNLPSRYVFYPAQFWPHKNHLYLLEGLAHLERRHGLALDAVFCGHDRGNKSAVLRQIEALGLTGRVHVLGFVPDDDIPAIYESAVALVMPTYFGPTNMPPIEAILLDCPVIYSDTPAFREQMGEAALYCDLADAASLADRLASVIQDAELVNHLREAGRKLGAKMANIDYYERLSRVLDDFACLRRSWT